MNPRCPKCGWHAISRMEWTAGGAIVRYWCPICGIEVLAPKPKYTCRTKSLKPIATNKTEVENE